jgi:hypothetical protein
MRFLDPFKSFFQLLLSQTQSQYYFLIIGMLGLLLAGAVTGLYLWGPVLLASPWFWGFLAVLGGVGIFYGIRYGIPRLREWWFLRKSGAGYVVGDQESPEEFHAKFLKSLQALKTLPRSRSRTGKEDPLYVLPLYLLIGEEQSGKTSLLRAENLFSPLIPFRDDGGTQNFDCWISTKAVVLDTTGRYVAQADKMRDRAEWYQLLRLLHHHRQHEPITGLIVAIGADELALQSEEKLRSAASRLRERYDEIVRELGCDFPVYLLVTKCDLIEGFGEFFRLLPPHTLKTAVGYVVDFSSQLQPSVQSGRGEDVLPRVKEGLKIIYDRLLRLRLSLLENRVSESVRQPVFCFPEEMRALSPALLAFAEPLFGPAPKYYTPSFRGVFFCSAQQLGAPVSLLRRQLHVSENTTPQEEKRTPYFLHDLFLEIIPRDRGLTTITQKERRRRGFAQIFGFGGRVSLLLLIAFLLWNAYRTDRSILASVSPSHCPERSGKAEARPNLEEMESCRVTVQNLIDQNHNRAWWSTLWWFARSFRLEDELRQRYVKNFQTQVLAPLNAELEQAIQLSQEPMSWLLLQAHRVQLIQLCLSSSTCSTAEDLQSDYPLLLDPQQTRTSSAQDVTTLQKTYSAYLLWQQNTPGILQRDLAEERERLRRWISPEHLSLDRLIAWVNRRSPSLTYEQYWELPAPLATVAIPQIDASCTQKSWKQDIAPFLDQLQDADVSLTTQLRAFRQHYLTDCLAQWQRFLTGFPQGAERWKGSGKRRALALRILTKDSPYQRVLADAWENLALWLPEESNVKNTPDWAEQLRSIFTSPQRRDYLTALSEIDDRLEEHKEGEEFVEASFKFVRDVFAEGKPLDKATNPVQRALFLAAQMSQTSGARRETNDTLGAAFLQEPVRYVWRVLFEQVSLYLQQDWDRNVRPPPGMPPADQLVYLFGQGGKVASFEERWRLLFGKNPLSEEKLTLPDHITKTMNDRSQFEDFFKGNASYPVQIRAGRRSDIEGSILLSEDQTILTVSCMNNYRLTTRPHDLTETEATIPWSYQQCRGVTLTIYFYFFDRERRGRNSRERDPQEGSPEGETKRFQLTKRYDGPTGFIRFLQDFIDGSHRFQLNDFDPAPDILEVLRGGDHHINVYFSVSVPPQLTKLTAALQPETSS